MFEDIAVHHRIIEDKEPEFSDIFLDDIVRAVFEQRGIKRLYKHQAEAIQLYREGKNIVIQAPTASGKTEIYLTAAVEEAKKGNITMAIYPTKALNRDQLQRFREFSLYGITSAVYDGDTPEGERKKIRENPPAVFITNFDMLHHILLNWRLFEKLWEKLSLIVVDELHYYSGVIGGHAANIIRRLKRLLERRFGKKPRFIATSATIANPKEFAEMFFEESFQVVSATSSKRKIEYFVIPTYGSTIATIMGVLERLGNKKTLIFVDSHNEAERIAYNGLKRGFLISAYRAGLPAKVRRKIEEEFKAGKLRMLSTTSALELGIDIGDVEAVVLVGFPKSFSHAIQRIGRAGRKGQKALAIIIAKENPLNQYYLENPEKFFSGKPESCYLNANNEDILKEHLKAMACEMIVTPKEIEKFPLFKKLTVEGKLKQTARGFLYPEKKTCWEARKLRIRGIGERVEIYEGTSRLGDRELPIALSELYPGGVYFYLGKTYLVEELDLDKKIAKVRKEELNFYTRPLIDKEAEVLEIFERRNAGNIDLYYGKVVMTQNLVGYVMKGEERIEYFYEKPLVYSYTTHAFWMDLPAEIIDEVLDFPEGLHAFEHVFINMTPAVAGNNSEEIGGLSYPDGRMYVYEGYPFGVGIARIILHRFEELVSMAANRLFNCDCERGCPRCILDPHCGNNNRFLDKEAAKEIASLLLKKLSTSKY